MRPSRSNRPEQLEYRRMQIAAVISIAFVGMAVSGGIIGMIRSSGTEGMLGFFSAALNAMISLLAYWAIPPGNLVIRSNQLGELNPINPNQQTQTNQQIGGVQVNLSEVEIEPIEESEKKIESHGSEKIN